MAMKTGSSLLEVDWHSAPLSKSCNFEKPVYVQFWKTCLWEWTRFGLDKKNHTNPWTPGRPRPGVFEYALGVCYQTIFEKKGVFP